MKTKPPPTGWLRILDIVVMVLAPLSVTFPFFLMAIANYQTASSTGTSYTNAIVVFFGAIAILILLGYLFGTHLKHYVSHQETKDEVIGVRIMYSIFILGSLLVYFMIVYAFLFGPKP